MKAHINKQANTSKKHKSNKTKKKEKEKTNKQTNNTNNNNNKLKSDQIITGTSHSALPQLIARWTGVMCEVVNPHREDHDFSRLLALLLRK